MKLTNTYNKKATERLWSYSYLNEAPKGQTKFIFLLLLICNEWLCFVFGKRKWGKQRKKNYIWNQKENHAHTQKTTLL